MAATLLAFFMLVSTLPALSMPRDQQRQFLELLCAKVDSLLPHRAACGYDPCAGLFKNLDSPWQTHTFPTSIGGGPSAPNFWWLKVDAIKPDTSAPRHDSWILPACSVTVDENRFAWLQISTMVDSNVVEKFDSAITLVQDSRALILDVRNLRNGSEATVYKIIGRFINSDLPGFRYISMSNSTADTLTTTVSPRGPWIYDKPMLVVFDNEWPGCGLADILEMRKRTALHFMPSSPHGGCDRNGVVFGRQITIELDSNYVARIPTARVLHPTKPEFEAREGSCHSMTCGCWGPCPHGPQVERDKKEAWNELKELYTNWHRP